MLKNKLNYEIKFIDKITLKNEIIDKNNFFEIGYCKELEIYMMFVFIFWIAGYYRYYKINEEDYNLYKDNPQLFYKKYENEIKQNNDGYTENFIGSQALRDYDGAKNFQNSYPTRDNIVNPFQHYVYINGILFARIVWEIGEFFIPPFQEIIIKDKTSEFPLRKLCKIKTDLLGNPICYYFPINNKSKNIEDLK